MYLREELRLDRRIVLMVYKGGKSVYYPRWLVRRTRDVDPFKARTWLLEE